MESKAGFCFVADLSFGVWKRNGCKLLTTLRWFLPQKNRNLSGPEFHRGNQSPGPLSEVQKWKKKLRRLMVDPIRFPMNSIRKKKEHLSTKDSWAEQPKTWEREDFWTKKGVAVACSFWRCWCYCRFSNVETFSGELWRRGTCEGELWRRWGGNMWWASMVWKLVKWYSLFS